MSEKYRSNRRDAHRILRSPSFQKTPTSSHRPESGIFSYSFKSSPFTNIFDQSSKANQKRNKARFGTDIARIREFIDLQYRLASEFSWLFDAPIGVQISEVNTILFGSFHKGLISLTTSIDLTSRGLIGPARPLLRWVFEGCLIAKYSSTHPTSDLFDRWVDGQDVYLTFSVLKKLCKPNPEEFNKLWKLLCQYTHSSVYSMQVDMSEKTTDDELFFNIVITDLLLAWSFHLLNRHIITSSMEYHQRRYRNLETVRILRARAKEIIMESREQFNRPTIQLLNDYSSSWIIKENVSSPA